MTLHLAPTQLLRYAGLFTWACVGIPLVLHIWYFGEDGLTASELAFWRLAYILFGACYWLLTRSIGRRQGVTWEYVILLALSISAIAVSVFSGTGLGAILLMVVSAALPWFLTLRVGIAWLVLQHMALVPVFANISELGFDLLQAFFQGAMYMGYSSFAFVTALVARQQLEARDEQWRLNSELRSTRALLAESSRLNERMRISRELHDLLGHHLTALSLNLEVANHLVTGKAQEHVRQAQSLAKLLLTDVREVVSQLRENEHLDLREALAALTDNVPALDIDLEIGVALNIDDPARAHVLLRCAQEAVTNAVKHARASRLWLSLMPGQGGVVLRARDNGHGTARLTAGNGLRGMGERLAQFGGRLDIDTAPDRGFSLTAWLPMAAGQGPTDA